jgi:hypothetical protein
MSAIGQSGIKFREILTFMKSRKRIWSEEELKRLAQIVAAGGTPLLAAAKFNRSMTSCRVQARKIGVPFVHSRIRRKEMLAKSAAD